MVRPLKQWLLRHRHNPYPTKGEKVQLAVGSNMTLVQVSLSYSSWYRSAKSNLAAANFLPQCPQVSNWFANARRRLKNVVQETRCSWSKRLRLYNQFVQVIFHPVHQSKKRSGRTIRGICHNLGTTNQPPDSH